MQKNPAESEINHRKPIVEKRSIAFFLRSFMQTDFRNGIFTNLTIYYIKLFEVLTRLTARLRIETPNFVKVWTRLSSLHGKSQYKMYGIAASCVSVLICCSFVKRHR